MSAFQKHNFLPETGFSHIIFPLVIVLIVAVLGGITYERISGAQTVANANYLESGLAGKCLDDAYDTKTNYTKVQLYACNKGSSQQWIVNSSGTIENANGACLDLDAAKYTNNTKIVVYSCNTNAAEQWKLTSNTLVNPKSGKCIDDPYSSIKNGTQLILYTCKSTANQKWTKVAATTTSGGGNGGGSTSAFIGLHADGNKIVTAAGTPIQLRGVSISGTEDNCVQGTGSIFPGNTDSAAGIAAMKTWHINAVRVPMNEDCWLGLNGAKTEGTAYQQDIEGYVKLLNSNGIAAILDLHWNDSGTNLASGQQVMADSDHSPAFWTSVATEFKGDGSVIFELYNEPHVGSWTCWLNGGSSCSGGDDPFPIAGMQTMLNAVRATGATNLVLAGGIAWSNDLSGWLANEPKDPLNNVGAAWHSYNFNSCSNQSCWTSQVLPVANKVPLVMTEGGENDCQDTYINQVLTWLNSIGQNYTPWAWFVGGCGGFPSMITDYTGDATAYGQGVKNIESGLPFVAVPYTASN